MKLSDVSIHAHIVENEIKTEQGYPLEFRDHYFMFDVYRDFSQKFVALKAAQVTFSTMAIVKSLWIAKNKGLGGIIYTLPTDKDVEDFVGGKVNRIIAQNPVYQEWTKDKDSVEQKRVGDTVIYYRGTWTKKAAIMVSSDLNIYDEVDASKQDVIEQYATRLQHSKFKWEWYFSHPSAPATGVDKYWILSDQKHWFIKCPHCKKEHYMDWPKSISRELKAFVCKYCGGILSDDDRRKGRWVAKYKNKEFSGYWIPLLICPWVTAKEILNYFDNKSDEYFWNKVLGLPYVGGGNKLVKAMFMQNLTSDILYPDTNDRVIIGIDTGKHLHLVIGGKQGLFYYDTITPTDENNHDPWEEVYKLMDRWPRAIAIVDQGGDLIGSRKFREKYIGRVFLCLFGTDRKTKELVRWGANDEMGAVIADRNRCIQLVVDEFNDRRIAVQGIENDWYDYWLHWNALTRIKEMDEKTGEVRRRIWVRSGDDHWALATVYWRVGISRFADSASIIHPTSTGNMPESPEIMYDDKIPATDPKKLVMPDNQFNIQLDE